MEKGEISDDFERDTRDFDDDDLEEEPEDEY